MELDKLKPIWLQLRGQLESEAGKLLAICRENELSLSFQEPQFGVDSDDPSWFHLLRIGQDRGDPHPRTDLNVTLRGTGLVYVWAYVEDVTTGRRVVDVAADVPPSEMLESLRAALAKMVEAVARNLQFDAVVEQRRKLGTKYDWTFEVDEGTGVWSAEVGDYSLSFIPEMSEGNISSNIGHDYWEFPLDGVETEEALQRLEAEHAKLAEPG